MLDFTGFEKLDIGVSTKLRGVWYNLDKGVLRAEFPNRKAPDEQGALYDYSNVGPEVAAALKAEALKTDGSVGKAFAELVEKRKDLYPYVCVYKP